MEARSNLPATSYTKIEELLKFPKVFQQIYGLKERRGVVWRLVNDLIPQVGETVTFKDICDLLLDSPYTLHHIKRSIIELHKQRILTIGNKKSSTKISTNELRVRTNIRVMPVLYDKTEQYCIAFVREFKVGGGYLVGGLGGSNSKPFLRFSEKIYTFMSKSYMESWRELVASVSEINGLTKGQAKKAVSDGDSWHVLHVMLRSQGVFSFDELTDDIKPITKLPISAIRSSLERLEGNQVVLRVGRGRGMRYRLNPALKKPLGQYTEQVSAKISDFLSSLSSA
jgi:DNA-binding transcriptional ArsR family regulator